MRQNTIGFLSAFLLVLSAASAQTGASIVEITNYKLAETLVAPGQILYLKLQDITTTFDSTQVATALPLPTSFNGLSVSLRQTAGAQSIPLPLIRGTGLFTCSGGYLSENAFPCVSVQGGYFLTVQIPYELKPNNPGAANVFCTNLSCQLDLNDAILTVSEQAGRGTDFRVVPVVDQVHILNTCSDNILPIPGVPPDLSHTSGPCYPVLVHQDGSYVTAAKPAAAGEMLALYLYGLGAPDVPLASGAPTPAGGVPITRPFTLSFNGAGSTGVVPADYAGLVEGFVGLYQMNLRVPPLPADMPSCDAQRPFNVTMTVRGTASQDQTSFCAQP